MVNSYPLSLLLCDTGLRTTLLISQNIQCSGDISRLSVAYYAKHKPSPRVKNVALSGNVPTDTIYNGVKSSVRGGSSWCSCHRTQFQAILTHVKYFPPFPGWENSLKGADRFSLKIIIPGFKLSPKEQTYSGPSGVWWRDLSSWKNFSTRLRQPLARIVPIIVKCVFLNILARQVNSELHKEFATIEFLCWFCIFPWLHL